MALQPDYTVGTITLTSGSKNFTTTGAALQTAGIQAGDEIKLPAKGLTLTIATITGQNAGTITDNCPAAAAGAGQVYRIRYQSDLARVAAYTVELIELLGSGNLEALAELAGTGGNLLPYLDGDASMATTPFTALARQFLGEATAAAMRSRLGAVGNLHKVTSYTSSGTHAFDAESTSYRADIVGAGGGGGGIGGAGSAARCSGGGGGGAYKMIYRAVPANRTAAITIGAGGAGGSTSGGNGGAGGVTTVNDGENWNAFGGAGGSGDANGASRNAGGAGGSPGSGGPVLVPGEYGGDGVPGAKASGAGGGSGGGFGTSTSTVGGVTVAGSREGSLYGGGGSGAVSQANNAAFAGGTGAGGLVVIWEYK